MEFGTLSDGRKCERRGDNENGILSRLGLQFIGGLVVCTITPFDSQMYFKAQGADFIASNKLLFKVTSNELLISISSRPSKIMMNPPGKIHNQNKNKETQISNATMYGIWY